ncbi:MAG: pyridoxamine 5'-phosphate oxidase family protein [Myxococcota bacterium]
MSPPWLPELRAALARNRRHHVQVATADPRLGPTVRTVVLRRVDEDGVLAFFTDARSEKSDQLRSDARAEILAWWPKGRVQFRWRGRASLSVDPKDPLRQQMWEALREEDAARFCGPAPGAPVEAPRAASTEGEASGIPATFAAVRLVPEEVDILRLDPGDHTRRRFTRPDATTWATEEITP